MDLDNRVPPPLVTLIVAALMWALAQVTTQWQVDWPLRLVFGAAIIAIGFAISAIGFRTFGQAKTTIDSIHIERATTLVTGGIFQYTRNPMYVGMTVMLLGWAVALASPFALLGPVAFVLFIGRFQIAPEERVMHAKFGQAYADYQNRVRRWV